MRARFLILVFALVFLGGGTLTGQEDQQAQQEDQQAQSDSPAEQAEQGRPVEAKAQLPGGVDGAVKLLNVGNSEWRIIDVAGDGAQSGLGGSVMRLRVGGRYHIDLRSVDSTVLPLDLRSVSGGILISQRDGVGTLSINGVDPQVSGEGISFTLTQELSERIASYRAAPYPAMVGFISVIPRESEQEPQEAQDEGDEADDANATDEESG